MMGSNDGPHDERQSQFSLKEGLTPVSLIVRQANENSQSGIGAFIGYMFPQVSRLALVPLEETYQYRGIARRSQDSRKIRIMQRVRSPIHRPDQKKRHRQVLRHLFQATDALKRNPRDADS